MQLAQAVNDDKTSGGCKKDHCEDRHPDQKPTGDPNVSPSSVPLPASPETEDCCPGSLPMSCTVSPCRVITGLSLHQGPLHSRNLIHHIAEHDCGVHDATPHFGALPVDGPRVYVDDITVVVKGDKKRKLEGVETGPDYNKVGFNYGGASQAQVGVAASQLPDQPPRRPRGRPAAGKSKAEKTEAKNKKRKDPRQ